MQPLRPCILLLMLSGSSLLTARGAEIASTGDAAPLEAIVVTSNKLEVQTLIDRKVYAVQSDVQSTFGAASDVLSAIPSIDIDADGSVSLRGDTHVLILIDGRPSTQFSGPAAGDNLQSIAASNIERVEVFTNPPAQYKADGAAGVINIITRKKHAEGTTGSVQGSLGTHGRTVLGASAAYTSGPLTATFTGSYREDYKQRRIQSDVIAPDPASGQPVDTRSTIDGVFHRNVPSLGVSILYELNDAQTLRVDTKRSSRGGLRTYTEINGAAAASGPFTESSQRLSSGHDHEVSNDLQLGFLQKLGRPGETLDLSAHRSTSNVHEQYGYLNTFFDPAAASADNLAFHENFGTTDLNADYTLPLAKTKTLQLGYSFEQDDYAYGARGNTIDPASGAQVPNVNSTNDFKFRQEINSVYASYQTSAGAWTVLGGLRGELTQTLARQLTDGVATKQSYLRAYPSLHVDRPLADESTLSFAASRRVTRPDTDKYNGYVDREFTPNLTSGNPNLKPQFTQSYETGYAREVQGRSYALTAYYRINRDSLTDVTQNLGNGVTLATKTNLPRNDAEGLEFVTSGRLLPKLTYNLSANPFRSQIDTTSLGNPGLQSTSGVNAKLKLDFHPTGVDTTQLTFTRTDKRLTPQGYEAAINIVNLGYRRQITGELTGVVTVTDLFDGQRYERLARTPSFTQDYTRVVQGRVAYVGVVYALGASKKTKPAAFDYDQ